jgi:hypothetical protein
MKPTDEVDDLLTRAGARWRADQDAPEPDLGFIQRKRSRRWVPVVAAATVAVIGAGLLAAFPEHRSAGPVVSPRVVELVAHSNEQANDALLVKPGDKVRVSGQVIAAPGKQPVFCAPQIDPLIGYPSAVPPSCQDDFAVQLTGIDLTRLTDLTTIKGIRTGTATLTGIWGNHSLNVQQQSAPTTTPPVQESEPPCPAPAGGWKAQPSNVDSKAVTDFLTAHADDVDGPVLRYPNGTSRNAPVVVMIGVAHGDLQAFRQEFEKVYRGNLCVAPVLLSRTDNQRVTNAVSQLMGRKELGIRSAAGAGIYGGPALVQVLAYTPEVKAALTPIGLDLIRVDPDIRPVG